MATCRRESLSGGAVQDLAAAMPPVKAAHGNPQVRSTAHLPPPLSAYPLPPSLVTVKGESLDEHTARTAPDFVTSLSIMLHVTTVVGRLHDAGWVHRDLKPTNAVFLAQQARWALVDFGCAARRGASRSSTHDIVRGSTGGCMHAMHLESATSRRTRALPALPEPERPLACRASQGPKHAL